MTIRGCAALVLMLGLVGCGQLGGSSESRSFQDAMHAYQAGDIEAFRKATASFDASHPRNPDALRGCTLDAFTARRMELYRATLANLDQPTVFGMSEEARLIYFEAGGMSRIANEKIDLKQLCGQVDEAIGSIATDDTLTRIADLRSIIGGWQSWKRDLGFRCGKEWKARFIRAAQTLKLHGFSASDWQNG